MTGQTLLNYMELCNAELQLQAAEADVTRGLLALNVAQDFFESLLSQHPQAAGDTTGTLTTSNGTETTAFPTGVLRIDRLQFIDPQTSRPSWDLDSIGRVGGHAGQARWPYYLYSSSGSGRPTAYWTNARSIYWQPLPDGTHTVRWYGLQAATDITAGGTFLYPDACAFPLASFAAKIIASGLNDDGIDLSELAGTTLQPAIDACRGVNRDGAQAFEYTESHGV